MAFTMSENPTGGPISDRPRQAIIESGMTFKALAKATGVQREISC
jgi:hypothetical protein